jgi:hypothetical protein
MQPIRPLLGRRDVAVVQSVAQLGHATSQQLHALHFHDTTRTPCDRALLRLTKHGYLFRHKRFAPVAGAGQYIYRLDRLGYELLFTGRFTPRRHNIDHSLGVGECVVALKTLERGGALALVGIDFEPDCHTVIGGETLKPDLYVHIHHRLHGSIRRWFEVDLGTEGPARIHSKLGLYRRARRNFSERDRERWPDAAVVGSNRH